MSQNENTTTTTDEGGTDPQTDDEKLISTDVTTGEESARAAATSRTMVEARGVDVYYGDLQALDDVSLEIPEGKVTAMIGPSGCGKSTFLRCINRMNDLVDSARVEGDLLLKGKNVYDDDVDPVALRRQVGMVFQEPNPFPKSIYDNVAYGRRIQGLEGDMDEEVEKALRRAALWDEVNDQLDKDYTVVIVTHNMQQAARISDQTAVFLTGGELVEFDDTQKIFENPEHDRVEDYITGKFG